MCEELLSDCDSPSEVPCSFPSPAERGISVLLCRHERKIGGEVGDSGRGSSAYPGAVDTVVVIRRPTGKTRPTLRVLQAISRFDDVPEELTVELTADGYKSLGPLKRVVEAEVQEKILSALAAVGRKGATLNDLVGQKVGTRGTLQRVLQQLKEAREIEQSGEGRRGGPLRYRLRKYFPPKPQRSFEQKEYRSVKDETGAAAQEWTDGGRSKNHVYAPRASH